MNRRFAATALRPFAHSPHRPIALSPHRPIALSPHRPIALHLSPFTCHLSPVTSRPLGVDGAAGVVTLLDGLGILSRFQA
jgi:hypothetical protein